MLHCQHGTCSVNTAGVVGIKVQLLVQTAGQFEVHRFGRRFELFQDVYDFKLALCWKQPWIMNDNIQPEKPIYIRKQHKATPMKQYEARHHQKPVTTLQQCLSSISDDLQLYFNQIVHDFIYALVSSSCCNSCEFGCTDPSIFGVAIPIMSLVGSRRPWRLKTYAFSKLIVFMAAFTCVKCTLGMLANQW